MTVRSAFELEGDALQCAAGSRRLEQQAGAPLSDVEQDAAVRSAHGQPTSTGTGRVTAATARNLFAPLNFDTVAKSRTWPSGPREREVDQVLPADEPAQSSDQPAESLLSAWAARGARS